MTPGLWGALGAVSWGAADFAARFSGRAIGHESALFGMLAAGSVVLTLWVWLAGTPLSWPSATLWLLGVAGLATMLATLWLYQALARGPVSIVSPIVGSYPALVVAFTVLGGARPTALQWGGMALTLIGVVIVARCADNFEVDGRIARGNLRTTLVIALVSSLAFAVAVFVAQRAVPVYGPLQTLWATRLVSLVAVCALFAGRRRPPAVPARWWPIVAMQGMLDSGGYLALYAGSVGASSEIAAVTASAFGAVTTLLARLLLREPMSLLQWLGIAVIFTGVAILSA